MIRALADAVLATLLAPLCAVCDAVLARPLDGAVCAACWARVVRFTPPCCRRCGAPLASTRSASVHDGCCRSCAVRLDAIAAARAIGPFEGALADIVHALKYARRPSIAQPLGVLLRAAAGDLDTPIDVVVPVPLHPRRERERGFNQAALLAAALGPPVCQALSRRVHTAPQVHASRAARWANVQDAFAPGRELAQVTGRRVALVDDVLTTGATLAAAAAVLQQAQPARIVALTAARAEFGRPAPLPDAPSRPPAPRR